MAKARRFLSGFRFRCWNSRSGRVSPSSLGVFLDSVSVVEISCKLEVAIDIQPGSDPSSINVGSKGVEPVAVLTTDDFDAGTVDPDTVQFAGASPLRWTIISHSGSFTIDYIMRVG